MGCFEHRYYHLLSLSPKKLTLKYLKILPCGKKCKCIFCTNHVYEPSRGPRNFFQSTPASNVSWTINVNAQCFNCSHQLQLPHQGGFPQC
mmetsp:Transcript_4877/g.31226  ORF Transcript_4877/g.31226 Transcript_4877/m.31226 type:complete len:90 (-) Transcript_4877:1423-1692(-)